MEQSLKNKDSINTRGELQKRVNITLTWKRNDLLNSHMREGQEKTAHVQIKDNTKQGLMTGWVIHKQIIL